MSSPPRIRGAAPADTDALVPLLAQLGYPASGEVVRENLRRLAAGLTDRVWVAEEGDGIVGLVSVHLTPLFHAPGHLGRITSLVVHEDARGRGVGSRLVREAVGFCWEAGCDRVELTSGDHRSGAHRFYERLGFQVHSRRFLLHRPP